MTEPQFEEFLDNHPTVEHTLDDKSEHILFRDPTIAWYQKDGSFTKIDRLKFVEMTPEELESAVYGGLLVEHITRVTGYFTKVSSWNKGKIGELKDRKKCDADFHTMRA